MHIAYKSEWIIIIGLLGMVAALYGYCAYIVGRKFFVEKVAVSKFGILNWILVLVALLGLVLASYAMFVEPYNLEVTHVTIPIDGLPEGTKTIRIAQISDLHSDPTERLESKLPEAIKNERPDLIFFTGDCLNSDDGFDNFNRCMQAVKKIAPTIATKGDWDFEPAVSFDPLARVGLKGNGAPARRVVTVNGAKLCIISVESGAAAVGEVDAAPHGIPLILLTHGPDSDVVLRNDTSGIDLICCGHTHGGQIALPFFGPLISQSLTKLRFASGLHKIDNTWIYTNRGIGMEGHFPRVRFCARPELTIYELIPSGNVHQDRHS